ncbi:MAG: hypothetical protein JSW63_09950 [Ignavibacterium sp.]|nr:MAG: hypothetical protein JSW63_09950 [Ignavibacterium sp.]
MKKFNIIIHSAVTAFMLLSFVSCSSSTQLENEWSDKTYNKEGFKKILILGMATKSWKKKVFENEFRTAFKKYNIDAVSAWEELPEDETLNKETFDIYFRDKNIDAVLVAMETGMSTKETMYGGGTSFVAVGFHGFYVSTSPIYRVPGYLSEEKIIYMDAKLFETTEGKLVWSATSQSYEPKTTSDVIKAVSYIVVDQLYSKDFIH